jgi:hypothetical protein
MSSFFDDLEAQLRSAAHAAADAPDGRAPRVPRARRRRWGRRPARIDAGVLAAVAVVVVVVVAAVALLGHGLRPAAPPPASPPPGAGIAELLQRTPAPQLRQEFGYIAAATRTVIASPACRVGHRTGASFAHGSPSPALVSALGVLARPAQPGDRADTSTLAVTPEVYAGHVRRALSAHGVSYYVVPARTDLAASMPSDRCFDLQIAALRRALPQIPPKLRAPTQALQAGAIAYFRNAAAHAPRDTVCLVNVAANDGGSACGITAAQIEAGMAPEDDQGTYFGLVPDGVASVTLMTAGRSVTTAVRGNVYAAHLGGSGPATAPVTVIWRSEQGRERKRISYPGPRVSEAECRRDVACAIAMFGGLTTSHSKSSTQAPRVAPARR